MTPSYLILSSSSAVLLPAYISKDKSDDIPYNLNLQLFPIPHSDFWSWTIEAVPTDKDKEFMISDNGRVC